MMMMEPLPFKEENGKSVLTGVCFLSCGCGNVIARWASVQQSLINRLPQGKPKTSHIINNWLDQNGLKEKWPMLKLHQYGIVVGETAKGFEMVNIMEGTTQSVVDKVAKLIQEDRTWRAQSSTN